MIIKNAKITKLIGVESSIKETHHVLTLVIEAKNINPADFKELKDGNIKIECV